VARGHFTVRRLERIYGKAKIRTEYDLIASEQAVRPHFRLRRAVVEPRCIMFRSRKAPDA